MDEILGYVADALVYMNRWLRRHVFGFTGFSEDEVRGYSAQLAYLIETGRCCCGGLGCRARHSRAGFGTTGVTGFRRFVWDAVIGPRGRRTGSIAQGMLYRLILRPASSMLIVGAELKRCHRCARCYSLLNCRQPGCETPFEPTETRVIRQPRLILLDRYVRVRRWGCSRKVSAARPASDNPDGRKRERGPRPDHYYQQESCRESFDEPSSSRPLRVHHNDAHDCCPLRSCSCHGQRHPERGTYLWVHRELAQQSGSHIPVGWGVIRRWARQRLRNMRAPQRRRLKVAIRAEPDAPAGRLDVLEVGRRLLTRVYDRVWSEEQRRQAIEEVREALANDGFDLDASDDWDSAEDETHLRGAD